MNIMSIRSEKDVTPKENAPRVKTAQVASIATIMAELVACVGDKYLMYMEIIKNKKIKIYEKIITIYNANDWE